MEAELVLVPIPGFGHITSMVEIAKLFVNRDDRLFITILVMKLRSDSPINAFIESLAASSVTDRIRFIDLPNFEQLMKSKGRTKISPIALVEEYKPYVKNVINNLNISTSSRRLAGFIIDMFCTSMIEVANEFRVPTYIFYPSSASFLALEDHAVTLKDEQGVDITEFSESNAKLILPGLMNPLPAKIALPSVMLKRGGNPWLPFFINNARNYRQAKGILVNSFMELESNIMMSLVNGKLPHVYPVGPTLNLNSNIRDSRLIEAHKFADIMAWLDDQPLSSVVFLCFGSMGTFTENQVKEIAFGLEQSGHRFLWSLRQLSPRASILIPGDSEDCKKILPDGFLDRTSKIGKVIGWAPQVAVLAHRSIGGFVSHCGWNSTLESLWFGVPMATWPLFADQQFNAFQMVVEKGLAVEMKMDYRKDGQIGEAEILSGAMIKKGIKCLMENGNEVREKVKMMSEMSKKAMIEGGSSHAALDQFIQDMKKNISI